MCCKHPISSILYGDVEEFCRFLKRETENDLSFAYEQCPGLNKFFMSQALKKAGAFLEDHFCETLLHVAVAVKDIRFVKLLIEAGYDINSLNKRQETALHVAVRKTKKRDKWTRAEGARNWGEGNYDSAKKGDESLIKFLLDHGANTNYGDIFRRSPLHYAVEYENPTIASMMLTKGAYVNKVDMEGNTPLHKATHQGTISLVELLLDNGADILENNYGYTPFILATYRTNGSSYDVLKLLLEKKANCNELSSYVSTTMHYVWIKCDFRTLKLLFDYAADMTEFIREEPLILHEVVHGKRIDRRIEYILDSGIDINIRNKKNSTALHIAAYDECIEGCILLLSKGADVNCIDDDGNTPLSFAKDSTKIIQKIFIKHIAKLVFLNIWVSEINLEIIEQDYRMKRYYKNCIKELEKMKIKKIYEDISLFNILMKKAMVSGYARNENLIEALNSAKNQLHHDFPIYYLMLKADFDIEVKKQRLLKEATIVLNEIFNFHDPFHLVNLKILSYLKEEDIIKINKSE